MTLASRMITDASSVFLQTDDFATTISRRPLGVAADAVNVTAIVDLDNEGTGPIIDANGERIDRSGRLHMAATIDVNVQATHRARDTFVIDGELWQAVRIEQRDDAMQTVQIARVEPITTKRTRMS